MVEIKVRGILLDVSSYTSRSGEIVYNANIYCSQKLKQFKICPELLQKCKQLEGKLINAVGSIDWGTYNASTWVRGELEDIQEGK